MATSKKQEDHGVAELEKAARSDEDRGLRGVEVDQTPNAHYSVGGVTAGDPTPETEA